MILVDTSVWVLHFRQGNSHLRDLLSEGQVMIHPWIIGELHLGNIKNRKVIFELLDNLPKAATGDDLEIVNFVELKRIYGKGIGLVDSHLLYSALISRVELWTFDKSLKGVAEDLGIMHSAV